MPSLDKTSNPWNWVLECSGQWSYCSLVLSHRYCFEIWLPRRLSNFKAIRKLHTLLFHLCKILLWDAFEILKQIQGSWHYYDCDLRTTVFLFCLCFSLLETLPVVWWMKVYPSFIQLAHRWFHEHAWGLLTHWGRVTHICVSKLTTIGSDNGLLPSRRQAIIWTNAGISLIGTSGTNFSEILIEIHTFSFKKMHLKMLSGKWRPFRFGLNVLSCLP